MREPTCRFDFREGAFFNQPDFQYISWPGGAGCHKNPLVFGAQFGINF